MNANKGDQEDVFFLKNIDYLMEVSSRFTSMRSLARELDVSNVAFTNMKKRGSSPSIAMVSKCADLFGYTIDQLIHSDLRSMGKHKKLIPLKYLDGSNDGKCQLISVNVDFGNPALAVTDSTSSNERYFGEVFVFEKNSDAFGGETILVAYKDGSYKIFNCIEKGGDIMLIDHKTNEPTMYSNDFDVFGVLLYTLSRRTRKNPVI